MNDKELIEYIKVHREYPKNFYDYLNYSIFIFPMFFAVLSLIILKFHKEPVELFIGILLFLFAILISILFQNKLTKSRKFRSINPKSNLTLDMAHELIKSNFKLLRSDVNYDLNKIEASEPMTFFSYGSEITLLFASEILLVNVRVGPYFQPFKWFRDQRIQKKLIKVLT